DVQAENEIRPGQKLHLLDDGVVPRVREDLLVGPVGKRVRTRRSDAHSVLPREPDDLGPHLADVLADLGDVLADPGADLDHRLMHLRLDPLLQEDLSLVEDLLDVRAQLSRLRIQDLELLLDAEGEGRAFHGNGQASRRGRLAGPAEGARGEAGFFARLWPFAFFVGATDSP